MKKEITHSAKSHISLAASGKVTVAIDHGKQGLVFLTFRTFVIANTQSYQRSLRVGGS